MRHILLSFVTASATIVNAAILVVDNTPGAGAPYSSLQAAFNSSANGDTIMVQPSGISYGNVDLHKSLVIIGPGHRAQTSMNATVGLISVWTGGTGSTIMGLQLSSIGGGGLGSKVHDLKILRNYFFGTTMLSTPIGNNREATGWIVEGNIFVEPATCGGCEVIDLGYQSTHNFIFRHNVFITRESGTTHLFGHLNPTSVLYHNIIVYRNPAMFENTCVDALFQNNIIWVTNSAVTKVDQNCTNCQWVHNLTYHSSATLDTLPGTNNLDNTDPEFVNVPSSAFDYDHDYHCAPGSPGASAASDGGMVGVHGGSFPFTMHGWPQDIPTMIDMILDNVSLEQGSNSTVRVKAAGGAN